MIGSELASIRHSFGLGRREFALLLGYTGESRNNWITIKRYETGERDIPPAIERLVILMRWYHQANGTVPDFDLELA